MKVSRAERSYDRRYKVPHVDGTAAKLCPRCSGWFAAAPRVRVCFACSPARERLKRVAKAITLEPLNEGRKQQVKGSALCRSLALEASRRIDYPELARLERIGATIQTEPVRAARRCPMETLSSPALIQAHERAVAEGRQGCLCGARRPA